MNAIKAIIFYCQLSWLKHQREAAIDKVYKEAAKAKTEEEAEDIHRTGQWEIEIAQHSLLSFQTGYYTEVARRKGLARAETPTDWEENITNPGTRHLTVAAVAELRSIIRQENKELREVFIPMVTVLISLIALFFSYLNYRKPLNAQQPVITKQE